MFKKTFSLGTLVFSEAILQEYAETLSSHKFDKYISSETRLQFLEKLIAAGVVVEVKTKISACRDPKDNKYLELAVECKASCIITGDNDLLVLNPFDNISILSPSDFLFRY